MLIIEIVLTVLAWRKGWHGFAVIPVAVCFAVGFMMGLAGAPSPMSLSLFGDSVTIVVLGVMVAHGRKTILVPAQS